MRLMNKKKVITKGDGAKTVIRVNSAQGKQLLWKIALTGSIPKSATVLSKPAAKKDDDDSDDDSQLTCSICLSSFWYANQTYEHMKSAHSIENPEKFIKDRSKKWMLWCRNLVWGVLYVFSKNRLSMYGYDYGPSLWSLMFLTQFPLQRICLYILKNYYYC